MSYNLPPTMVLPALVTLHTCSAARVLEGLRALQDVYFPHTSSLILADTVPALKKTLSEAVPALRPKRIPRLVHHERIPDSGYASAEEDEGDEEDDIANKQRNPDATDGEDVEEAEALDLLRSDELERGYAIKWLTGLVKRGDTWVSGTPSSEEQVARATHLEEASKLLARFAGNDTPEEALTRAFLFPLRIAPCHRCHQHHSDGPPITVELNDAPIDGTDHTAVGLQSWGSAIVFAERMCLDPERYLGVLHPCASASIPTATIVRPRRVLELGAGTGLLSITAARVFSRMSVQAEVDATDYHPSVLVNLARNVRHNPCAMRVSVEKLDWCAEDEGGGDVYDVVLAADVVYQPEHAMWIRECVERKLNKGGVFWMVIPVRTIGRHEGLGESVEEAFSFMDEDGGDPDRDRLAIVGKEGVERMDGVGRADEGGYTLFEIRWV